MKPKFKVRTPQGIYTGVELEEVTPPSSQLGRWWKLTDALGEFDVWPETDILVEAVTA